MHYIIINSVIILHEIAQLHNLFIHNQVGNIVNILWSYNAVYMQFVYIQCNICNLPPRLLSAWLHCSNLSNFKM